MEINVKVAVQVDLSEKTAAFIERLIGVRTSTTAAPVEAKASAKATASAKAKAKAEPEPVVAPEPEAAPEKSAWEKLKESNPAVKEMAEKFDLEPVEISDNELREALDECRKRLLGAEPKKNPYYSVLTNFIRTLTADTYGAAVPREIAQERRQAFIDDLKTIENDNAGGYQLPREEKLPF